MTFTVGIKIDVDTERGTRIGVPQLQAILKEFSVPATFLFSLGPDNTGRAIKRIFRPGFFQKVQRTSVISTYGWRTLGNGVFWPGPHIGKRHEKIMREVEADGHEVGIHTYDHTRWQDDIHKMSAAEVETEFNKATTEFARVFGFPAQSAGAAGWQANANTLQAYDNHHLLYGSDTRGAYPFFPRVGEKKFATLQIPTTLPTLDELLGRPEFPYETLAARYVQWLRLEQPNIFTIHAELEGMRHLEWFREILSFFKQAGCHFSTLADIAKETLLERSLVPVCELIQGEVPGRSGLLAKQDNIRESDS
jgi:undecaprenyl phosphate-alpha-L-ara4FN deformylase